METLLIVVPGAVFFTFTVISVQNLQLDCSDGLWMRSGRHRAHPYVSVPKLKANEASYAFIAVIIAGTPMMFMTRVML